MNKKETNITIPCSQEEYYYKLDNMVLSSSQCVRNILKTRWKIESGKEWVDDKENIQTFLEVLGRDAYKKAQPFQKKILNESSTLEDWDMSLLYVVIRNFGNGSKYEKENSAVGQLKDLRNELAHNTSKKYTETRYNEHVKKFKHTLGCLGLGESYIDKMIEKAGVTSSLKAYERVKVLFIEAEKFMKEENFKDAIERYSEAITTPSLLPINLGEAYEKRANCYLKSVKSKVTDGDHCDQALLDIEQALELNSSSWNANYLAAQCHRRKNNLTEALRFYETSLALSPAQKQVKRDKDTCKVLAGVYSRKDNLNPHLMPRNLEERVADYNNELGTKISKEEFIRIHRDLAGIFTKGQDHVFRGHQYFHGWDVEQSFTEAVKYYTKADIVGNPDGSYNLAMCYHYGRGVEADLERALKMYKRVAEMDRNICGPYTPLRCNRGVAAAQHALGLYYDKGTGVEQDHLEAAMWYQKAMENGVGNAANNLGILYSKGQGVKLDEKMAEMCWKQGVRLRDVNAADSLVSYNINQMEPETAEKWIKIGREMGNDKLLGTSDEEYDKMFRIIRSRREILEPMVLEFETRYNLGMKGLTFQQRFIRALKHENPNLAKINHVLNNFAIVNSISPSYVENFGGKKQPLTEEKFVALFQKAQQGSTAAIRIFQTLLTCRKLNHLLKTDMDQSKKFKLKILDLLYECAMLEFQFFFIESFENKHRLIRIVADLFEEFCEHKGAKDVKIRYCYLMFNLYESLFKSKDTYPLKILKEGVRRYSDNQYYNILLLCCMEARELWEEGFVYAKEALAKLPDNVDILYNYAVILSNCKNVDYIDVVSAYEKFLNNAPNENRKVPEAFYHIALVYFSQFRDGNTDMFEKARFNFKRGQEAEKDQLPCYLPYGESNIKGLVSGFVGILDGIQGTSSGCNSRKTDTFVQPKSVLERKSYLQSPVRRDHILKHRQTLNQFRGVGKTFSRTFPPKLVQTVAKH